MVIRRVAASGSTREDAGTPAPGPAHPRRRRHAVRGAILPLLALLASGADARTQTVLKPGGGDVPQGPPVPESVATRRAAEFVATVSSGDPGAITAFVQESLTPGSSSTQAASDFGTLAGLRHETGGLDPITVRTAGPRVVEIVARSRLTGWQERIELHLEARPPHRIQTVALRPPEPPAGIPEGPIPDERLAREAEALISALGRAGTFSGAVLLARGDQVLFSGAYGEADREADVPNRLDTRFGLGSMNKMFTAVAVAQLVEAGRLSFEDPLSKFLPDHFAPGAAEKIRIEHLLSHTSGLGDYFTQEFRDDPARYRTIDDLLELNRGDSLAFEPGTGWRYSNTGYLVLGKVIEVVSGQDYHDYVREHIYRPAGMENTGAVYPDDASRNVAVGYSPEYTEEGVRFRNNLSARERQGGPAGGGWSTVGDLHRFALALMRGRLVSPSMVETLTTPKPELSSPTYGFGFRQYIPGGEGGRRTVGHGGEFPGVSAQLNVVPSTGRVLVVLSNYGPEGVFRPVALRKLIAR